MRFLDQDALPETVEGRYPESFGSFLVHQTVHALAHFTGCLVGEGDGAYVLRCVTLLDQPCNLAGDDTGFATAGAGQHQAGPVNAFNRLLLRLIEILQVQSR